MYYGMGDDKHEKALSFYNKVIEQNPENLKAFSFVEFSNYVYLIFVHEKKYFEVYDYTLEVIEKADNIITKHNEFESEKKKSGDKWLKKTHKLKVKEIDKIRENNEKIHASCWAKIYNNAATLFENEKYEESLQNFEKLLKLAPDSTRTLKMIARNFNSLDRHEEEKNTLIKVAEMDQKDINTRLQLASIYFSEKQYDKAANWYHASSQIEQDSVSHYFNMGICYNQIPDKGKSTLAFSKVVELDPNNFDAFIFLSRNTEDKEKKKEYEAKAYKIVQKAIENDPHNLDSYTNASSLASKLGKKDEAVNYLIKAVEIDPTNKDLLKSITIRLNKQKRFKDALKYSNMLIDLGSPEEDAILLNNYLKQQNK